MASNDPNRWNHPLFSNNAMRQSKENEAKYHQTANNTPQQQTSANDMANVALSLLTSSVRAPQQNYDLRIATLQAPFVQDHNAAALLQSILPKAPEGNKAASCSSATAASTIVASLSKQPDPYAAAAAWAPNQVPHDRQAMDNQLVSQLLRKQQAEMAQPNWNHNPSHAATNYPPSNDQLGTVLGDLRHLVGGKPTTLSTLLQQQQQQQQETAPQHSLSTSLQQQILDQQPAAHLLNQLASQSAPGAPEAIIGDLRHLIDSKPSSSLSNLLQQQTHHLAGPAPSLDPTADLVRLLGTQQPNFARSLVAGSGNSNPRAALANSGTNDTSMLLQMLERAQQLPSPPTIATAALPAASTLSNPPDNNSKHFNNSNTRQAVLEALAAAQAASPRARSRSFLPPAVPEQDASKNDETSSTSNPKKRKASRTACPKKQALKTSSSSSPAQRQRHASPQTSGSSSSREAKRSSIKTSPRPQSAAISKPMALEGDADNLSAYQRLMRQQIEFFEVTQEDIMDGSKGRNHPIHLGQVGIRCRHCAQLPLRERKRGSMYFATTLEGIYQSAQHLSKGHLLLYCQSIPSDVRTCMQQFRQLKSTVKQGGKLYWAQAAKQQGVEERDNRLVFRK